MCIRDSLEGATLKCLATGKRSGSSGRSGQSDDGLLLKGAFLKTGDFIALEGFHHGLVRNTTCIGIIRRVAGVDTLRGNKMCIRDRLCWAGAGPMQ